MPIFNIILSIAAAFIIYILIVRIRLKIIINRLPGPKTTWPMGNSISLMVKYEDLCQTVYKLMAKFSSHSIVRMWIVFHPTVVVLRASAAEAILRSTSEITKGEMYRVLDLWLGKGLLTSTGRRWNADRKMLTPCFHFQILNSFMDVFNEKSLILVNELTKNINKEAFDLYPYITLCTLDVICESAMGKNINAQVQKSSEYVKAIVLMSKIVAKRICYPWYMLSWIYRLSSLRRIEVKCLKTLHGFTENVIRERREERKSHKKGQTEKSDLGIKTRVRFLDLLLDMYDEDNDETNLAIREQVDTFMFEGHDTTACSLAWTLYFLGRNPEIQQKVRDELDTIFGGDAKRSVTPSDLTHMKYLEAVIKESMRLVPVVPLFSRNLEHDFEIDGYTVPAGVSVTIMPYFIHRDPALYDRPDVFDPDRFLKENSTGRHPYGFLGFSAGPRNCIGQKFALMEEKVVLSHVLRNFKITSRDQLEDIKIGISVISKPLNGIYITLQKL